MKVVFDTNVFVSAFTLPGGRGDQALDRIVAGEDSLAFSKPILDELLSVLARKFSETEKNSRGSPTSLPTSARSSKAPSHSPCLQTNRTTVFWSVPLLQMRR